MCARWPDRCAATAISCCRACAIRSACRPVKPPTATAPASISTSIPGREPCRPISTACFRSRRANRASTGALVLAAPAGLKDKAGVPITPWRISAKIKADPAAARLEQLEASYGSEDSALKFAGAGDIRFGASPLLRAVLSARQLDADKFVAKDNNAAEPMRLLPGLRALMAAIPQAPIPTQIEFSAEQIMLGGRPLQNFAAELHADARSLIIDRLDFRAPGATRVTLSGANAQAGADGSFKGALSVDSSDPDTLVSVAAGPQRDRLSQPKAAAAARRCQRGLGSRGHRSHEGRDRWRRRRRAGGGSKPFDRRLAPRCRAEGGTSRSRCRDGAGAFAGGPAGRMAGRGAVVAGCRPRHIGRPGIAAAGGEARLRPEHDFAGAVEDRRGQRRHGGRRGQFRSRHCDRQTGAEFERRLARPDHRPDRAAGAGAGVAAQCDAALPGPARLKLSLDLDKNPQQADRANARAVLDLDAPQLKGIATITAKPDHRGHAVDRSRCARRAASSVWSRNCPRSRAVGLLALLGLDRAIAAGEGPAQFEGSVTGVWRAPLRLKVKMSGTGLDAEAQGTAEPWASEPKASVNLKVRSVNLAPLIGLKPIRRAGAKHQPVVARLAGGQQVDLR